MLEFIRSHHKIMQVVLFIFIVPSFVLLGVEGYSKFFSKDNDIVKIDGQSLTQEQFDNQFKDFINNEKAEKGDAFNLELASSVQNRKIVLEQMINGMLMQKEIERLNIKIDDIQVINYINQMPALANIKNSDGSINIEKFTDLLKQQGFTIEQFQARIKYLLVNQYLAENIAKSSLIPNNIQQNIANGLLEKRDVQVVNIDTKDFISKVEVNPEQLKKYYTEHTKEFIAQESVDLQYILLSKADIAKQINKPTEGDIKKYYDDNIKQFKTNEERRASHILIKVDDPSKKNEANKQAQEILAILKKEPNQFAKLAKEKSADIGSAQKDGDLGFFSRGAMVKNFEDTVFKLKPNEISEIIETEFGFHIIKLNEIKAEQTKSLAEVNEVITQTLLEKSTQETFNKKLDELTNLAIDSKNLDNIAKKFNLELKSVKNVKNNQQDNQSLGTNFADKRALRAIFEADVKSGKRNSDVIQFGDIAMIANVKAFYPQKQQSFEEAKTLVENKVKHIEALKLAKQMGVAKLAAAKQGEILPWSPTQTVTRMESKLPKELVESIFSANPKTLPNYIGIPTELGYVLFKVNKVEEIIADNTTLNMVKQFTNAYASEELRALLQDMKEKYKVKIIKDISLVKI